MAEKLNAFWITITTSDDVQTYLRRIPDGNIEDAFAEGAACARHSELAPFKLHIEEAQLQRYAVKMTLPDNGQWHCVVHAYDENHLHLKVAAAGRVQHQLAPGQIKYDYNRLAPER